MVEIDCIIAMLPYTTRRQVQKYTKSKNPKLAKAAKEEMTARYKRSRKNRKKPS